MKIFVTGGAGFIGRNLIPVLKNETVRIFDNLSNSSEEIVAKLVHDKIDFVKGDILNYDELKQASKGFDVIIHLAAKIDVNESVNNPEMIDKINVEGTKNIVSIAKENFISKIIFASSAAVYGNINKFPINEEAETNPLSPYGESKLKGEQIIQKFTKEQENNSVILRIFNIYGKEQNGQYAGVITKFLKSISKNEYVEIFGDGKQTRDFVYIDDVIESIKLGLEIDKKYVLCNIASGVETSIIKLAETMFKIYKKPINIKNKLGKNGEVKFSVADIMKAKKEMGFEAKIKLEQGIKKLVSISE